MGFVCISNSHRLNIGPDGEKIVFLGTYYCDVDLIDPKNNDVALLYSEPKEKERVREREHHQLEMNGTMPYDWYGAVVVHPSECVVDMFEKDLKRYSRHCVIAGG